MLNRRWQNRLAEFRRDRQSDSDELAACARELFYDAVADSAAMPSADYRQWLLQSGRRLVAAQPAAATVYRLVNDLLWAAAPLVPAAGVTATDGGPSAGEAMRWRALDFLQDYATRMEDALAALAKAAAATLAPWPRLMTFGRSAAVLRTLEVMADREQPPRVWCGEARPLLEGQSLASELTWLGLDVTLGTDMALFSWLAEVQGLVVGAESLSAEGMVARLGTAPLAAAAAVREVPFVVLCPTYRFVPADYVLQNTLPLRDGEEIMPRSNDHLTVVNVAADITPLEQVSWVVTENGPVQGEVLAARLEAIRTYPGLRGREVH